MTAASDAELLRLYSRHSSQEAFAALVARHLGLVHAAALRQVRSPDLARDVAQAVFIELARDAEKLRPDCVLPAWLHTATRRRAIDLIRAEARRKRREEIACAAALDPDGRHDRATCMDSELLSRIDEALSRLPAADREALILRFFSGQSLREVGQRFGLSENAAQKRVERALERLRATLRVGGAGGAGGFGAWLSANAAPLAPAGLAPAIACTALSTKTALATGAFASALLMTTTQKTLVVIGLALAAGIGAFQYHNAENLRRELDDRASRHANETRAWTARLDALEAENRRLRAEAGGSQAALHEIKADAADPAIAAMSAWFERLQNLKDHLAAHPEATTPEMSLLTNDDWLDASKAELKTERDYRRAAANLRSQADQRFQPLMQEALRAFEKANAGSFPTDLAQLLPYLENPVDPRMLERWTILPQREILEFDFGDPEAKFITQFAPIDESYDGRVLFNAKQNGSSSSFDGRYNQLRARLGRLYRSANAGRDPTSVADLLPLATDPKDRKLLEDRL